MYEHWLLGTLGGRNLAERSSSPGQSLPSAQVASGDPSGSYGIQTVTPPSSRKRRLDEVSPSEAASKKMPRLGFSSLSATTQSAGMTDLAGAQFPATRPQFQPFANTIANRGPPNPAGTSLAATPWAPVIDLTGDTAVDEEADGLFVPQPKHASQPSTSTANFWDFQHKDFTKRVKPLLRTRFLTT